VRYLQHSDWANGVYKPYFGDRCTIWPVGIDTDQWMPSPGVRKTTDFLIYDKIHWNREKREADLLAPIRAELNRRALSFETIQYGRYDPAMFRAALARCRAMVFLSAHESQGIAAQEAMSCGVPLLAWDPGSMQDPYSAQWGPVATTSVPWFDDRCGLRFADGTEFGAALPRFLALIEGGHLAPRDYIVENLTLATCAQRFIDILDDAYGPCR
jgi:glycosyltransferase involved in cell wall biosynthesis